MPDFKVTFRGDLTDLARFDSAIQNSARANAAAMEAANKRIASAAGKITGKGVFGDFSQPSGTGQFLQKQKTVIDSYNRTFRQQGDVFRRTIKDYIVAVDELNGKLVIKPVFDDQYVSSFDKAIGNTEKYERAIKKTAGTEKLILAERFKLAQTTLALEDKVDALTGQKAGRQQALNATAQSEKGLRTVRQNEIGQLQSGDYVFYDGQVQRRSDVEQQLNILKRDNMVSNIGSTAAVPVGGFNAAKIADVESVLNSPQAAHMAQYAQAYGQIIHQLDAAIAVAEAPVKGEITNLEKDIEQLRRLKAKAEAASARTVTKLQNSNPAYAQARVAATETPPIDRDLANALANSKQLRQNLLASGLGGGARYGTQDFQKALAQQEAQATKSLYNIRTGVKTLQGSFKDLRTGELNGFTVDLDKQGKVVGRWGGQLAGAGQFLKQTVRDFQKVVEWTVATTLVFGTLAAVVGQLKSINELNTSLARFAITAQLSAQDTKEFFKEIGQVAIETATPLGDMVKVADDIALATRTAGQSTEEWKDKIIDLTTAVGIFTNLTGTDTVQAADLLSAAFKQLQITPDQLTGVLSKVTAVAGGQSQAIADIVQALGTVGEAGKAAGLSIDEQIAAVQVLSQVTNKSSADIATSFKNLFGSISSVGSVKILKSFGIEVRDAAGGIKPFLQIYREIGQALETGVIPQNRLPDVLRGISGGPRRAPDAAALLSNLGRIDEVTAKSVGASNEALIANAKVLDTNAAKIQQFQNAVDIAVFERLGNAVEKLTASLTSLGTSALGVFNGLDPALVSLAIQFGLVVGATKLLGTLGKNLLIPTFKGIGTSIKNAAAEAKSFVNQSRAIVQVNSAGKPYYSSLNGGSTIIAGKTYKPGQLLSEEEVQAFGARTPGAKLTQYLQKNPISGRAKIGAGLGLGALALAGGSALLSQTARGEQPGKGLDIGGLGTLLQIGGSLALVFPSGFGQVIGAGAILAGTGLQFLAGQTQDVSKAAEQSSQEVYTLTQKLQESQDAANGFADAQKSSLASIKLLNSISNKTAADQDALAQATTDYVTATLALADANTTVSKTFDDLLKAIPGLGSEYSALKSSLSGLSADSPEIKKLQQRLAQDILKNTGQAFLATSQPLEINPTFRSRPASDFQGSLVDLFPEGLNAKGGLKPEKFQLSGLLDSPDKLSRLFGPTGIANVAQSQLQTPENLGYIQAALSKLPDLIAQNGGKFGDIDQQRFQVLVDAVQSLAQTSSSFAANTAVIAQQGALVQSKVAIGAFTQEQGANATVANTLATRLNEALGGYRPPGGSQFGGTGADISDNKQRDAQKLIDRLNDAASKGIKLDTSTLIDVTKLTLDLSGNLEDIGKAGKAGIGEALVQALQSAGASATQLESVSRAFGVNLKTATDDAKAMADALNEATINAQSSARDAFGQRSLQLLVAENSGEYEKNAKGLKILKEQNVQAYESTLQLISGINTLGQDGFVELANALSNVTGLTGLYTDATQFSALTDDQKAEAMSGLALKLVDAGLAAGLNAEQIKLLTAEVLKLGAAVTTVPDYKKITVEIETVQTSRADFDSLSKQAKLKQLQGQLGKATKDPYADFLKQIEKIFKSGSGSTLGQLPKKAAAPKTVAYNQPGLLDIPDEIVAQANYRSLVNQAVATAKKLQSQVPGEAAHNKNDIVELLNGTKRVLETRGIGEEYLRRAMDELTGQIKRQNDLLAKADTIRRIRVGAGDFSALANVPVNSQTGASVGGPNGPINVTLNINGTVLTPAQFSQFADLIAAQIKRQLTG